MLGTMIHAASARLVGFAGRGRSPRASQRRATPALEGLEARRCLTAGASAGTALAQQLYNDAQKFVLDAAVIETFRPTLLSPAVDRDLVGLNNDLHGGSLGQTLNGLKGLDTDLANEAVLTSRYRLPLADSLLAYQAAVTDLQAVANDVTRVVAYVKSLAGPSTPTVAHALNTATTPVSASSSLSHATVAGLSVGNQEMGVGLSVSEEADSAIQGVDSYGGLGG